MIKVTEKKRQRYITRCKNGVWTRWKRKYFRALQEWHNMTHRAMKFKINIGDIVNIRSNEKKNWETWKIGIIQDLYRNHTECIDEKIKWKRQWGSKHQKHIWNGQSNCGTLQRLVVIMTVTLTSHQPIEFISENNGIKMNINAPEFKPKRTAVAIASMKIKDVITNLIATMKPLAL